MQVFLCSFQSDFWQRFVQYRSVLHLEQVLDGEPKADWAFLQAPQHGSLLTSRGPGYNGVEFVLTSHLNLSKRQYRKNDRRIIANKTRCHGFWLRTGLEESAPRCLSPCLASNIHCLGRMYPVFRVGMIHEPE